MLAIKLEVFFFGSETGRRNITNEYMHIVVNVSVGINVNLHDVLLHRMYKYGCNQTGSIIISQIPRTVSMTSRNGLFSGKRVRVLQCSLHHTRNTNIVAAAAKLEVFLIVSEFCKAQNKWTSRCRRKFSASVQMSELSRMIVSKLLVDCSKWLRPKLQSLWRR